ncbi:hypothetical protein BFS86_20015 [Shewanella algae]|nr:hypothetical protein BFS86_20015 [Shewanella algae]
MSFTFKLLKNNDPEILDFYKKANDLWTEILSGYDGDSSKLAKVLSIKQTAFEWLVQDTDKYDRWDGQEIMVFSGLSYYLDNEEDENNRWLAKSIAEAFELSFCSIEVKGLAKRASNLFYIGGY